MTFYPQRDMTAIGGVPGCDQQHERPVDKLGRHVHPWAVTCPAHEAHYRGDGKAKILKYATDKKTGAVIRQERVPDADPRIGFNPDTIPLTYDEQQSRGLKLEKGENQLRALEALLTLKGGGIDLTARPEVMFFLQESGLPSEMLQGKTVCVNGHDAAAGSKFCPECGASMAARGAVDVAPAEPEVDLERLHVASLRKLCRDKGLADKGSKDELIGRLKAAEKVAA